MQLSERLHKVHPGHPGLARQFADIIVARALLQGDEPSQRSGFRQARSVYERLVDIGDNKDDVQTLGSLAFFQAGDDNEFFDLSERGQSDRVLRAIKRAWRKFEIERYPPDIRFHAENVLALWGAVLLTSQSQDIVTANFAAPAAKQKPGMKASTEYLRALKILFPDATPRSLSEISRLKGIGPRIGCVCMLTVVARARDNARDFYLSKILRWQNSPYQFTAIANCARDLRPHDDDDEPGESRSSTGEEKKAFDEVRKVCHIEKQKGD
jgi:hypothetical protein